MPREQRTRRTRCMGLEVDSNKEGLKGKHARARGPSASSDLERAVRGPDRRLAAVAGRGRAHRVAADGEDDVRVLRLALSLRKEGAKGRVRGGTADGSKGGLGRGTA